MIDPFHSQSPYPPSGSQVPPTLNGPNQIPSLEVTIEELGVIPSDGVINTAAYIKLPVGNQNSQTVVAKVEGKKKKQPISQSPLFKWLGGPQEKKAPVQTTTTGKPPSVPISNILIRPEAYQLIKECTDQHAQGGSPQNWKEVGGALYGYRRLELDNTYTVVVQAFIPTQHPGSLAEFSITQNDWVYICAQKVKDYKDCGLIGIYHSHPGHRVFHSGVDDIGMKNTLTEDFQISMIMDPKSHDSEVGIFVNAQAANGKFKEIARFPYMEPLKGFQPKPAAQAAKPSPTAGPIVQQPPVSVPPPLVAPAQRPLSKVGLLPGGYNFGMIPDPASLPAGMPPQTTNPISTATSLNGLPYKPGNVGRLGSVPTGAPPPVSTAAVPSAPDPGITLTPQVIYPSASPVLPANGGLHDLMERTCAKLVREAYTAKHGLHQIPLCGLELSNIPDDNKMKDFLQRLGLTGEYELSPIGTGADLIFDVSNARSSLTEDQIAKAAQDAGISSQRPLILLPETIGAEYFRHSIQQLFPGSQAAHCGNISHADLCHTQSGPSLALDMTSGAHVNISSNRATMTTPEDDALRATIETAKAGNWQNINIKAKSDADFAKTARAFLDAGFALDPDTQRRAMDLRIVPATQAGRQPRPGDCQRLDRLYQPT